VTIAGPICTPTFLFDYQHGDLIWDCTQPLPIPSNCATAAPAPTFGMLSFQISPNPSNGQVVVHANFGAPEKGRLSVLDIFGKCMLEKNFDAEQLDERLQLVGQKPGVYFVRLEVDSRISTRKLVLMIP